MTVTFELSPTAEAKLRALASARGLVVSKYLESLIDEQSPVRAGPQLSPAERAAMLRDTSRFPSTPPLSDEAISRESMYGPRG